MKIKRFFIRDTPQRTLLMWEDQYGNWIVPEAGSASAVAQGYVPAPMGDNIDEHLIHPEVQIRPIYGDYIHTGDAGESFDAECIIDSVVIEAYRRLNAGWYVDAPEGDVEMPVPGIWRCEWENNYTRLRDA